MIARALSLVSGVRLETWLRLGSFLVFLAALAAAVGWHHWRVSDLSERLAVQDGRVVTAARVIALRDAAITRLRVDLQLERERASAIEDARAVQQGREVASWALSEAQCLALSRRAVETLRRVQPVIPRLATEAPNVETNAPAPDRCPDLFRVRDIEAAYAAAGRPAGPGGPARDLPREHGSASPAPR